MNAGGYSITWQSGSKTYTLRVIENLTFFDCLKRFVTLFFRKDDPMPDLSNDQLAVIQTKLDVAKQTAVARAQAVANDTAASIAAEQASATLTAAVTADEAADKDLIDTVTGFVTPPTGPRTV